MALRVYIDGYLQRNNVMRDPGVTVTRELDGYTSRAEFRLKLAADAARPKVTQHVLVRDDQQLLRNSNRMTESPWIRSDVDAPTATWGALPSQVGGNGLRWDVTENATNGYLQNYHVLVEHPLDKFGDPSGAVETRYFVFSMFLARGASPTHEVTITAQTFNGTAPSATGIDFNLNDGSYTVISGTGEVLVDDTDPGWWRVVIVETMTPSPSAVVAPTVDLFLSPRGTATTCCWQISEVSSFSLGLTWDEASMVWNAYTMTWDELPSGLNSVPAYLDRRNVSANEFLGVVAEAQVSWLNHDYVFLDILAVDYRIKMRRTLVTETYTSQTDEAIITSLISTAGSPAVGYAPYLGTLFTGDAVGSLSFTWANKSLDQCLDDITAQTGKPWRIHPEAFLQYGPAIQDQVAFTIGDSHNLLKHATDLSQAEWQKSNLTATAALEAIPGGGTGMVWTITDTSGSQRGTIRQDFSITASPDGEADFTAIASAQDRTLAGRFFLKKDSATTRYVGLAVQGLSGVEIVIDSQTGDWDVVGASGSGTFDSVLDDDGNVWYDCTISRIVDAGSSLITFFIAPSYYTSLAGAVDLSLTGSAEIYGPQFCVDAIQRFVFTDGFRSYEHDPEDYTITVAGDGIADLVNRITVQSDEAGTYSHTADDTDSQAEYGVYEDRIIDSTLTSNAQCQRRAEVELAQKAWPRESANVECWYKTNLDVGMLAVVTQQQLLQSRAIGQIVQKYTLRYQDRIRQRVSLELSPYNFDRVTKALRRALSTTT